MNAFDNATETRATVLIIDGTRVNDVRVYDDGIMQTVIQRWGTGGGNVPMIFDNSEPIAFDTQFGSNATTFEDVSPTLKASQQPPSFVGEATAYSIREDAQANNFSATETDTALALQANRPSVQSHHAQLFIAQDEPFMVRDREGKDGGGKGPLVSDKSFTLATSNFQPYLYQNPVTVRRLTPMECERLQGFPDGWTGDQADSNRYKQMGNAVAVPVVQWIINGVVGADRLV